MRACPACRRPWPDEREVCPRCLAELVDDLDATITCSQCGHVCPARMQTCPSCFALLRAEDRDLSPLQERAAARGKAMSRPPGRTPFAEGHECTVLRQGARSRLVLEGPDGLVEASLTGPGVDAVPPLRCTADDRLLFRIEPYPAADGAVVVVDADGGPLATFLRRGRVRPSLDIRDETSAPVARVETDLELVETGGGSLGALERELVECDGWVDDEWTLSLSVDEGDVPLRPVALVALPVAAKVLLGLPTPIPVGEQPPD